MRVYCRFLFCVSQIHRGANSKMKQTPSGYTRGMATTLIIVTIAAALHALSTHDGHHAIHKDNTFIAAAHAYARIRGEHSCWVCGLLPTSTDTYPYLAVPFNLIDYLTIFNHTNSPLYRTDVNFTPRPISGSSPEPIKITYAPKGLICWVNAGSRMMMGQSVCDYYVTTEQRTVTIVWDNKTESVSLPEHYQSSNKKTTMNGTMFVCGRRAFKFLPPDWKGSCYIAYIVPAMRLEHNIKNIGRSKRDLFGSHEVIASPGQRFFAAIMPFYGTTVALDEIRQMASIMENIANDTAGALSEINSELNAIRKVTLQNRMALDIVLADKGGTCAVLKQECCTYIPDSSSNITDLIKDIYENVNRLKKPPNAEDYVWLWGNYAGIVKSIMAIMLPITIVYAMFRMIVCVINRLTTKSQRIAHIKMRSVIASSDITLELK